MSPTIQPLFQAVQNWIDRDPSIISVALFGSSAGDLRPDKIQDEWSDFDLHIVSTNPGRMENIDWSQTLPDQQFCVQSVRPASGGVRKVTAVFAEGQLDLVVVPRLSMVLAKWGYALGLHRYNRRLAGALVGMRSCLRSGYRMLKGGARWGGFYERVYSEVSEIRLADCELVAIAEVSLVDQLWIMQKLHRGEIVAAQHQLHSSVADINLQILRELRLRRKLSVPSFGLGRHVERLLPLQELGWVRIDARCDPGELHRAVMQANAGLVALMHELVPSWKPPASIARLLNQFSSLL